jgi:hypothetical protein
MPERPSQQKRPGETIAEWRARSAAADAAAAQTAVGGGYTQAELKAERDRFRAANGAGGIGGARKAATAEFKAREKKHMDAWKAAKRAKKQGQKKVGKKLGEAFSKGGQYLP